MAYKTPHPIADMTGRVFGHWTVLARDGSDRQSKALWLCRCECGEERTVLGETLRNGRSQSCGCRVNVKYSTAPEAIAERFWNQVDPFGVDGCWLWIGRTIDTGYGQFYPGRTHTQKQVMAHRWAYEHVVGPIPEELELDHLCRVRNCVNPDHLEPVTREENIRRGVDARAKRGG